MMIVFLLDFYFFVILEANQALIFKGKRLKSVAFTNEASKSA
jgi:hypothetical protein